MKDHLQVPDGHEKMVGEVKEEVRYYGGKEHS